MNPETPANDCALCPRLAAFRKKNKRAFPDKFNAPVPSFGPQDAKLLIVGLAPGLKGANFTGRPFTGDYAGDLLYATLLKFGLAQGSYNADLEDGLTLVDCRITNAVRCVPPENKPTGPEIKQCQDFLNGEFENLPHLKTILALGKIAHTVLLITPRTNYLTD
jgi:uracil-DNA glycosylase